jgi:hypothetical protein
MIRRFVLLAGIIVTVLAFYAIAPDPGEGDPFRLSVFDRQPAVASAFRNLSRVGDTLRAVTFALERQRAWETARALPARAALTDFVVMPGVPADIARKFEQRAREQFARFTEPRTPLRVVLTSSEDAFGYRKYAVLPETESQPCVIVVGISTKARGIGPGDGDRLLGACGFYAKFGQPGGGTLAWLKDSRGVSAAIDTISAMGPRPQTRRTLKGADIAFSSGEAACLAGRNEGCVDAVLDPFELQRSRPIILPTDQSLGVFPSGPTSGLSGPGNTLANLRAHVGDARFQEIWSSPQTLDQAYETATGEHIAVFARKILLLENYPHKPGPLRGGLPLFLSLSLGLTAAAFAITRTRRERSGT